KPMLDSYGIQGLGEETARSSEYGWRAGHQIPVFAGLQEPEAIGGPEQRPLRRETVGRRSADRFRILQRQGVRPEDISFRQGQLSIRSELRGDRGRRAGSPSDRMARRIR